MRTLRGLLWAELGVPGANVGGGDLLDFGLAEVWKNQPLKLALVEFASPGRQSPALNIVERVIAEASQCLPAEAGGAGGCQSPRLMVRSMAASQASASILALNVSGAL